MSEEARFSLTNDKRLVTDKELAYNEFGTGTFAFSGEGGKNTRTPRQAGAAVLSRGPVSRTY
jgi:hypothetical protein